MTDHDDEHRTDDTPGDPQAAGDPVRPAAEPPQDRPGVELPPYRIHQTEPQAPLHTEELPTQARADEGDWFWWSDGERARHVSEVPERPDLAPGFRPHASALPPASPWEAPPGGWSSPPPAGRHRQPRRGTAVLAAVVAAAVLIASGVGIGWGLSQGDRSGSNDNAAVVPPPDNGSNGGGSNAGGSNDGTDGDTAPVPPQGQTGGLHPAAIADQVGPAVVVIKTVIGSGAPGSFADGGASGTGMIVTSEGEILTNNHVIRGATTIQVSIDGRGTYDADVVGADPTDDVALLQIEDVSGLPTVNVDTSNLTVGSQVVAIGNAYGEGSTSATTGNITALEQDITAGDPGADPERLHGLIQTDAPIAPGDSGGALVDPQGEVIGMITAATRTSSFSRTSTEGYAITIEDALSIVDQIRSGEASGDIILGRPGLLGVQVGDMTNSAAARLGLSIDGGALVLGVVPQTPAAQAGITQGSAITVINGNAIGSSSDLSDVMHTTKPGDQADVTWVDGNGSHSATVQLITGPAV